jgi:tetratricopeptide (TPR) repeat protein
VYARFDTLDLGGELIKNARLFVGDLSRVSGIDLLLGADFFLSHRMYFSAKQNKLYFTYNGGPVFDLRAKAYADTSKPIATDTQSASAAETPALSAADLRRRGAASASRGDFQRAMADFDQAIRLDSSDAENFYERGTAYASTAQLQQAVADFDKHLKSGRDISVLCWRAEQYVCRKKIKPQRMPILMQSCILAKMIPTIS